MVASILCSLPSLINNCLSLLFGTRGGSRKAFFYKQEIGDREGLCDPLRSEYCCCGRDEGPRGKITSVIRDPDGL